MGLSCNEIAEMNEICKKFRKEIIEVFHMKQTGHPGGSLSECEYLTVLYKKMLRVDPKNPKDPNRDRLVLCKGHGIFTLYCILAECGFMPWEELRTYRDINTRLQGHPCMTETPGVDLSSGPLGVGLGASVGISLALKLDGSDARVYPILGDGELNEGTVWEAAMAAVKYHCDNICALVDWNGVQLDGTVEEVMPMHNMKARWDSWGWNTIECDGHDVESIYEAYELAKTIKGVPTVILAHTVKGKGVSFMEGQAAWHGGVVDDASYEKAMAELGGAE